MQKGKPLPEPIRTPRPKPRPWYLAWLPVSQRQKLEHLQVGSRFRLDPDCPAVNELGISERQQVVYISKWDHDGYGNYVYTIVSRSLDGTETRFGTSTYGVTEPGLDIRPKHILID